MSNKPRYSHAESAALASLLGNTGLALGKGCAGLLTGSSALIADAVRSASDAAASLAALAGLRSHSAKQVEPRPRSLFNSNAASTILVSLGLLLLGLELAISSIRSIAHGVEQPPSWIAAAVVAIAFLLKEWLLPFKERRLDLFASILALAGTAGAAIGGIVGLPLLYYLDPAAAFVISMIVLLSGYRLISGSVLRGRRIEPQEADADELLQVVQRIEGVITVEELKAWEQGHYVSAELRISVNPRITVQEGHEIAKRVRELLLRRFIHLTEALVTIEPYAPEYPYKSNHDPNQEHQPTLLQ